uniref:Snurportin-1 n=2 Tax=Babesia bovis TaxID=5865 RepID=A7ASJ7_BABBO|eukprot:XP_001611084.1 hypothetical protein [Babesia bovis T2Bo]
MEDCENPGSSVTRLGERLQSKRIINLGAVTRERRLVSLRTLRQNVVESKRTAFLDRLMRAFTDTSDDSVIDDIPIETDNNSITTIKSLESIESPLQDSYDDLFFEILSERNKQNYRNVMGILTVHEFLLATEMVIREEAIALKNSLMFVRPEGSRVLIIVVNNRARVYRKNGFKCTTFKVAFTKGPTVLDCIVNDIGYEKNKHGYNMKYYVLDVLVYNGYSMAHSDTECRTFFIKSRLEEAGSQYCNPSFVMLTYNECTPENMRDAYYQ